MCDMSEIQSAMYAAASAGYSGPRALADQAAAATVNCIYQYFYSRGTLTRFYILRRAYQGLKYLLKSCYPKYYGDWGRRTPLKDDAK